MQDSHLRYNKVKYQSSNVISPWTCYFVLSKTISYVMMDYAVKIIQQHEQACMMLYRRQLQH